MQPRILNCSLACVCTTEHKAHRLAQQAYNRLALDPSPLTFEKDIDHQGYWGHFSCTIVTPTWNDALVLALTLTSRLAKRIEVSGIDSLSSVTITGTDCNVSGIFSIEVTLDRHRRQTSRENDIGDH